MNKRVKNKWVKALRSGKYKKTTGALRKNLGKDKVGYCCLGVLCDLYAKEVGGTWNSTSDFVVSKKEISISVLPQSVRDWAGLKSSEGDFGVEGVKRKTKGSKYSTLTDINDVMEKKGFNYIADVIEKHL